MFCPCATWNHWRDYDHHCHTQPWGIMGSSNVAQDEFRFYVKSFLVHSVYLNIFWRRACFPLKCMNNLIWTFQAEISKCVVKKDLTPEHNWLSSSMESLKYFLTTLYVYIMKEPWTAEIKHTGIIVIVFVGYMGLECQPSHPEDWARQQILYQSGAGWPSTNVSSAPCLHFQISL